MISIILVEPKTPGNIGAIARVMKNFGFSDLILVRPHCNHLTQESVDRASHAADILRKAKKVDAIPKLDYLIGTTARLGTDYNLYRSPLHPEELAEKVKEITHKKVGILFGREDSGLNNIELAQCDFTVTIQTSKHYASMNLSHGVSVILYELSKHMHHEKIANFPMMGTKEKDALLTLIYSTLDDMTFPLDSKKETQKKLWQRIVGKATLTKREHAALMGYFKKVKGKR
jgi:tRNA/rRNA methyltransferase